VAVRRGEGEHGAGRQELKPARGGVAGASVHAGRRAASTGASEAVTGVWARERR
jgi:hypothetical protein